MLNWTLFAIGAIVLVAVVSFVSPAVHTRSRLKRRSSLGCLIFGALLVGLLFFLARSIGFSRMM